MDRIYKTIITYVDDFTASGSYFGFYEYTDSEITFNESTGIIMGNPIPADQLVSNTYHFIDGTMTDPESNSSESPEKDENGKPLYPIVLTFVKK